VSGGSVWGAIAGLVPMLLERDSTKRLARFDAFALSCPLEQHGAGLAVAEQTDYVIGVDAHRDRHSAAIVTGTAALVVESSESADHRGYESLLAWARRFAEGRRVWAVEGSGS